MLIAAQSFWPIAFVLGGLAICWMVLVFVGCHYENKANQRKHELELERIRQGKQEE